MSLQNVLGKDLVWWCLPPTRIFTVRSAYGVALKLGLAILERNHPQLLSNIPFGVSCGSAESRGRFITCVASLYQFPSYSAKPCASQRGDEPPLPSVSPDARRCDACLMELWACPYAQDVWALASPKLQKVATSTSDFYCIAHFLFRRLDKDDKDKWLSITWALWVARNKFVFEGSLTLPSKVVEIGNNLWGDYTKARVGGNSIPRLS